MCVLSLLLPKMIPLGFVPWEVYHQLPPLVEFELNSESLTSLSEVDDHRRQSLRKPGARPLPALARKKGFGNVNLPQLALGIQALLKIATVFSNVYMAGSLSPHHS